MKSFVKNEASYINGTLIVEKGDFMATCGQQSQFSFQSQEFDGAWWENMLILHSQPASEDVSALFSKVEKYNKYWRVKNILWKKQVYFSF